MLPRVPRVQRGWRLETQGPGILCQTNLDVCGGRVLNPEDVGVEARHDCSLEEASIGSAAVHRQLQPFWICRADKNCTCNACAYKGLCAYVDTYLIESIRKTFACRSASCHAKDAKTLWRILPLVAVDH